MKVLKLEEDSNHVIVVEKGDRLFSLDTLQSAIVLGPAQDTEVGEEDQIHATTIYPENLDSFENLPFSVTLTACVREFLEDPEWVMAARQRISEKEAQLAEKEANKEA